MPIVLENSSLRVVVDPAMGGKITSLRDQRSGREWLWRNPHLEARPLRYGASYVEELDTGGWDEIFPSVSPCLVAGHEIPDHGDLVSLPWEVIDASANFLEMAVTTRFAKCRFTRSLRLDGESLEIRYGLENRGDTTVPWLWCAHPLVAIEPGMRIDLPQGTAMRVDGGVRVEPGESFRWPHLPGLPPLDVISSGDPSFAIKMFTAAGSVGEVGIVAPDGRLGLSWDREAVPFLGLWLNCHAWSGCGSAPYFNLGVEPATAPFDSLADAMADPSGRELAPGESQGWSLLVSSRL
jgi:hypothetical protein